jgi:hypothetical protein
MWVFLGRWFRRYVLVALALPVVGWVLDKLGVRLEQRFGPRNPAVRSLRGGGTWLAGQSEGPLARRLRRRP